MKDLKFEDDYKTIKISCLNKEDVSFYADKQNTCFQVGDASEEWTKFPPSFGSQEELDSLRVRLSVNPHTPQYLTLLELEIYRLGGEIFYKYRGESHVSIKFVFEHNDAK